LLFDHPQSLPFFFFLSFFPSLLSSSFSFCFLSFSHDFVLIL
jgi:hypothetical protein